MVDTEIILAKASAVSKHLRRVQEKVDIDVDQFLINADLQDIVLFNLQMAIQNCIDIAAHIISDRGLGVPGSNNEMFYMLEENRIINRAVAEKMVRAIGFRNLIAHEYARMDLERVFQIARQDINDLKAFIKTIITACNIKAQE
jgi:uncharacterized protein YutE (UPF0331/DUF86 family)